MNQDTKSCIFISKAVLTLPQEESFLDQSLPYRVVCGHLCVCACVCVGCPLVGSLDQREKYEGPIQVSFSTQDMDRKRKVLGQGQGKGIRMKSHVRTEWFLLGNSCDRTKQNVVFVFRISGNTHTAL